MIASQSPKDHNKTVIKAKHRNYLRVETHTSREKQPKSQSISSHPFHNISNQLFRAQNTRSTYLKRVKIGSCRIRAENENQLHHLEKLDCLAAGGENLKKQYPKYREKSSLNKQLSFKSFAIRKKNASNYSKKKQQALSKCQLQPQKVMLEIIIQSKESGSKGQAQKSVKIIDLQASNTKPKGVKPKSVHILQINLNQASNTIKMKAMQCRQLKKTTKYFRGEAIDIETKRVTSIQKKSDKISSKDSQIAVKEVKIMPNFSIEDQSSSKLNPNQNQLNSEIQKEKPKSLHLKQKGNYIERSNTRGGCKTIRVPWQPHGASFNSMKSRQSKKCEEKLKKQWQDGNIQDQMFGRISIIPQLQSKKLVEQAVYFPPQSLNQIFLQLDQQKLT